MSKNNDTIYRQAAIGTLMEILDKPNHADFLYTDEICKALSALPPAQQWIPVTERLPEPRIDVWCNSDMGQMVGYYEENVETWYGRNYLELMVTAWMPLPEPWEEERREDGKTT